MPRSAQFSNPPLDFRLEQWVKIGEAFCKASANKKLITLVQWCSLAPWIALTPKLCTPESEPQQMKLEEPSVNSLI